jgi:hypothetical protein
VNIGEHQIDVAFSQNGEGIVSGVRLDHGMAGFGQDRATKARHGLVVVNNQNVHTGS